MDSSRQRDATPDPAGVHGRDGATRPVQRGPDRRGPLPISDKLYSKLWEIEYYPNKNLKREELKDPQGHPVLRLLYQWDKQNNLTQVREDISGWQADLMWNAANHLTSVQTTVGTGPNPFPLPPGLTTVTTDDSGNILEMANGDWVARFAYDYENRPTRIEWNPGEPVVEPLWDAVGRLQGYRLGGREVRFVLDGDRPVEERDGNNQKIRSLLWDGGRLYKIGEGASALFLQNYVSGSPLRMADAQGNFTGGALYSRSGMRERPSQGRCAQSRVILAVGDEGLRAK